MRKRLLPSILKKQIISVILALAISAVATSVVFANSGGASSTQGQSASYAQYGCPKGTKGTDCEKPGCGNEWNDGISGNSGNHGGQPPKSEERGDCPHDPGIDGDDPGAGGNSNPGNGGK